VNNLRLDAILPDALRPQGGALERNPKHILLTGATGFIGGYLLAELMATTRATLHCLVRGESRESAEKRLVDALSAKGLWTPQWIPRLTVHPGDLEADALGLDGEARGHLAATIGAIYHCGARVSFAAPYANLKAANVDGTVALIGLACSGRPKVFHHISTLGVFDQVGFYTNGEITEETIPELRGEPLTGYAASKWVAEQLVDSARRRGLVASIHRPGTVAGATNSGHWNQTDLVPRAIKSCIQLGAVPELAISFSLTPVDFVARAIVAVAHSGPPFHAAYHPIASRPVTFTDVARWLRLAGYQLDSLPYDAWQSRLRAAIRGGQRNGLGALSRLFLAPLPKGGDLTMPELFTGGRKPWLANSAVMSVVGSQGKATAAVDERVFLGYVKRWLAEGFLPPPAEFSSGIKRRA
jgi:nonribosomal peptide synthetase DhbF